jgi:hypothetical protein
MEIKNTYLFGKFLDKSDWTAAELSRIGVQARGKPPAIKDSSRQYILDTLSKVGGMFADK